MTATRFVWDEDRVVAELDDVGAIEAEYTLEPAAYGNLLAQKRDSERSYYHFDALGSTRDLTDTGEVATDEYSYYAFGKRAASSGTTVNPYRWVGELGYFLDEETGYYSLRQREYDANSGRFLSEDPIRADEENLYRYTGNDPVNSTDPSGLEYVRLPQGICLNSSQTTIDDRGSIAAMGAWGKFWLAMAIMWRENYISDAIWDLVFSALTLLGLLLFLILVVGAVAVVLFLINPVAAVTVAFAIGNAVSGISSALILVAGGVIAATAVIAQIFAAFIELKYADDCRDIARAGRNFATAIVDMATAILLYFGVKAFSWGRKLTRSSTSSTGSTTPTVRSTRVATPEGVPTPKTTAGSSQSVRRAAVVDEGVSTPNTTAGSSQTVRRAAVVDEGVPNLIEPIGAPRATNRAGLVDEGAPKKGPTHGHHSDPKFMGGDPKQPLTDVSVPGHKQLHKDLNEFLRRKTDGAGNHMRPQRGNSAVDIAGNFSRRERLEVVAEFYKKFRDEYPDSARDFFKQHPHLE